MPSFPRDQSKANISSQQTSFLAPQDNTGEMIQKIGEGLGNKAFEIGLKLKASNDATQKLVASNNFKIGMLDISSRAENDPNYNNSAQYFKEIEKLKTDSLKGVSDPVLQQELGLDFNLGSKVGEIQVQSIFKKKGIDVAQAETLKAIDVEVNNPTENSLAKIQGVLDSQVSVGNIDHKDAYTLLQKANKDLGVNRVNDSIFNAKTSEEINAVRNAFTSGAYEKGGVTIDGKEKNTMLKSIDTKAKQIEINANFAERVQRQNDTHELIDLSNNSLLTPSKLEEYFKTNRISNSTYKALQDTLDSPVGPTANTDKKTYYDLTNSLLKENVDPEKSMVEILKANADGKLSKEDAKKLYEMHLIPSSEGFKSLANTQGGDEFTKMKQNFDSQIAAVADKRNWFKSAFRNFNEFFSGVDKEKNVVGATQKLIDNITNNKIKNEDIPAEADKIIGQENLKSHPDWAKLPEKGKKGVDRFGNKVVVYPDGRIVKAE